MKTKTPSMTFTPWEVELLKDLIHRSQDKLVSFPIDHKIWVDEIVPKEHNIPQNQHYLNIFVDKGRELGIFG